MIPREQTLASVRHPDIIEGRAVLIGGGVNLNELSHRIQHGDPASGWEGDVRMVLCRYVNPTTREEQIELWRLEHDGEYRQEARLRPDASGILDPSNICAQLVERDARRGYNIKDAVDRHNAGVQREKDRVGADKMSGAADKLAWAIKRDLGIRSTWAAPNRKVGA